MDYTRNGQNWELETEVEIIDSLDKLYMYNEANCEDSKREDK